MIFLSYFAAAILTAVFFIYLQKKDLEEISQEGFTVALIAGLFWPVAMVAYLIVLFVECGTKLVNKYF